MTDTGQVPGEGLPESAGMVEQPGVPAHGAYTYLSDAATEDDELLMPGAQGAWGNEVPPPAPEPAVEPVHQPGPHETAGRDSGSVDLNGVRLPDPAPVSVPPSPILSVPHDHSAGHTPRRPLHLGPPIPDASASPVRSLADRGPAGTPVRQPGPPTTGPEYLDVQPLRDLAPQNATPWGAQPPVAQVGAQEPAAETVVPGNPGVAPSVAAQPAVSHVPPDAALASDAVPVGLVAESTLPAPEPSAGAQAQSGVHMAHGHDGVYPAPGGPGAEGAYGPESGQVPRAVQVPEGTHGPTGGPVTGHAAVAGTPAHGLPVAPDQLAPNTGPGGVPDAKAVAGLEGAPDTPAPEVSRFPESAQAPEGVPGSDPAAQQEANAPQGGQAAGPDASVRIQQSAHALHDGQAGPDAHASQGGQVQPDAHASHGGQAQPDAAAHVQQVAHATQAGPVQPEAPAPDTDAPVQQAAATDSQAAIPMPGGAPVPPAPDAVQAGPATPADGTPAPVAPQPAEADHAAQAQGPQTQQPAEALPHASGPIALGPVTSASEAGVGRLEGGAPEADASQPGVAGTEPHTRQPVPAAATPEAGSAPAAPSADQPAADQNTLPSSVPLEPQPDQPLGEFVPVEGQVPTTPHLAPTPPQPLILPTQEQGEAQETPAGAEEPVATVPAPREAEPAAAPDVAPDSDAVQHAEDLETRAADQEEGTATPAEARRSTGPAAPGYEDAEREAVLKVMRERRDIRNGFRSDPIPHEVLLRVLEAAHTAPSVGHSQPWDFVVIRSAETRRTMHELAMRQRDAYAKSLPKGRAKQFKELKIEAILDTPVNIVVTADSTRGGRHTLGRHTQPQMAPYSSALAVENLWLAARAEGLGVGWVSFFDEREMVRALGLPEHLEVVAYLCVGYVDEFPDEPELMQAGWSKRRPLSWVVHEETYGRRALPGENPHDLLAETVAGIRPLDAKALGEAWERQKRMTKPAGALGMLEIISAQLSGLSRQCPPPIPEPAAVAIFAGDHGVHAQGVTPWPQEVTAQMVANFLGGGAVCNAFAAQVGAEVCVVDVGVATDLPATPGLLPRKVRAGTSDMTTGPAMTREEVKQAIEVGIETARDLVAAGNKALLTGEMGIANTTASAALISVFTGADPAEVTGRGTGINDETLARKTEVVRRALELHQPDPADPIGVLAAVGGFEHAAMVGLLLGGASLRTPVILDGVSAGAAALVARAIAPEVLAACIAGHRSAEPGHVAALNKLGLRPLVDLDLRLGEGTGALLALPLVQSTARAMHEVATFDSAGVTEK
ncbi:nicotinate-nucleotide--dimethylbenzimidazole phosphoribosyltransferase [Streptomyces brasiliensis]|uniref:Nicotinate-nucleotide--dimethylbenzimidazole phosphoribosyltransferase n=1 Tax=Streptomyces brasiliensis TaxID=1954 RepID=A0A917K4L0_9ACTN|nr:nicotinate-nucleotide--dimethylbenzimidazole phosphoribosyltransferase [Streptomyces brasiliensis]GGJ00755.1 nicotinate-nucleotide--dimethylbenzimidazole phosphoribosyltransferase [Streptomyces brasiliensis]